MKLPTRKEMNLETMQGVVEILSEYKGGDDSIMGELFWMMFEDLSVTKQESYIIMLKKELKRLRGY